MKKYMTSAIVGLFTVALFGLAFPAVSYSASGSDVNAYAVGSGKKLGRGIINAATGWVEFFRGIYQKSVEHDPVTGVLYGSLYGTGMVVVRTVSGAYDAGTFLFPFPSKHQSTISPTFVWQDWKR